MNALGRDRVQRQIAGLAALPPHLQVFNPAPVLQVTRHQLRRFFTAQAVVQQHRQNRTVSHTFERRHSGSIEQ